MTVLDDIGQLSFPMHAIVPVALTDELTIQQRFEQFHALNGWVYDALEMLTADYLARGRTRIGIGMLAEVLRWQYGRQTTGDAFRLNNNHRSRYSRMLVANHPEWADVFETRALRAE